MNTGARDPAAGSPSYRLRTLGLPALLRDDGTPIDLPLGKPFALLVYVAMERDTVTRDDLASLLWPRVPRERGRQSVRQALLLLRRALGPDVFTSDDLVRLEAGRISVDTDEFRGALARRDIDRANALWEGPFLDRFGLAVGHAFQTWVEEQRSAIEQHYATVLDETAAAARKGGSAKDALDPLRRAIRVVPYNARLHTHWIETLIDAKAFSDAEAALIDARRLLGAGNPGFDPELLEQRLNAQRATAELQRTGPALDLEFVGRTAELAELHRLWRQARSGQAAAAFINGPTGIGKSRLAEEAAAVARIDGAATVLVKASEAERQIEFGVAAALIRRLLKLRGAAGISGASDALLRSLVPSLSGTQPSSAEPDGGRAARIQTVALSDAMADLLSAVAEESPLVIVLDDLHWADAESVSILASLLRQSASTACLFLLTRRQEDAGPALQALVRALEYERIARTIDLAPLSRSDVAELVGLMATFAETTDIDRIAMRLHNVTGGNPLFIVEILRTLQQDETLAFENGEWRFRSDRLPAEFPLPASLRLVVDQRLERLSAEAALVAGHLARAAGPATVADLRSRTRLPDGSFTRAASELIDREVLCWIDPDGLDFTHDQLRDAARRKIPVPDPTRASSRSGPARRRRIAALLAVLLIALAVLGLRYALSHAAPPLYGGGLLYFVSGDSEHVARPPRRRGESWIISPAPEPVPAGMNLPDSRGPQRMPDGSLQWFEYASRPGVPPWVERVLENGERTVIARDSGDATFISQSPDGRFILFARDDPATEAYEIQAMIANGDGSNPRPLRPGAGRFNAGGWAPDGSAIAAGAHHRDADSLLLITPAGNVAGGVPIESRDEPGGPVWCTNDRIALVLNNGDQARLALWHPSSPEILIPPLPRPERAGIICSPDGSAVVYNALVDGVPQFVVGEIATGEWEIIPLPDGAAPKAWLGDAPPVVERRLEITGPDSIALGDRFDMSATITMTDRSGRDGPVHWASSDPFTISIDSTGHATANRPGAARIVATSTSWLSDTAEIRVFGSHATDWLFHDDFAALDTAQWLIFGDMPDPQPVIGDDGPALWLHGNGQYRDGLIHRRTFTLPRGGTLETEFRLPLTRWDRQRVAICLEDADTPLIRDGRGDWNWTSRASVCFDYPKSGSDSTIFEPDAAWAIVNRITRIVRSGDLPTDGWTHVAIQLQPNGHVLFLVNRRLALESPARIPGATQRKWRIAIDAASSDTRLLVRNLTLWDGQRY